MRSQSLGRVNNYLMRDITEISFLHSLSIVVGPWASFMTLMWTKLWCLILCMAPILEQSHTNVLNSSQTKFEAPCRYIWKEVIREIAPESQFIMLYSPACVKDKLADTNLSGEDRLHSVAIITIWKSPAWMELHFAQNWQDFKGKK